jgi:xanthine dehydrogenase accessory factor
VKKLVIVRGAGDLASGCILRLMRSGFSVLALEVAEPLAVRRTVCFSEAVYEGSAKVEDATGRLAVRPSDIPRILLAGEVAVLVDPDCSILGSPDALSALGLEPLALVDAIMAKRNTGTRKGLAPLAVALGPGFTAGRGESGDVDAVVETMRGHDLGRVIRDGRALPNTGIPGSIGGKDRERVIHAPFAGRLEARAAIGDLLGPGDLIGVMRGCEGELELRSPFEGILRGLVRGGIELPAGVKLGDIDPRCERGNCFTVSDKSLAVAGGVLEAILSGLSEAGRI